MSQNGLTHFKIFAVFAPKIFKVCLTTLGHYALKGSLMIYLTRKNLYTSTYVTKIFTYSFTGENFFLLLIWIHSIQG